MRICPYCHKEIPDLDFNCPYCHKRLPSEKQGSGHASFGDLDSYNIRFQPSEEDKTMIRDKNHQSTDGDSDDIEPDQPYSFVTHENGDRN